MTLEELCAIVTAHSAGRVASQIVGDPSVEITGIADDSRLVHPGEMFVCIAGEQHDGHDHAPDAVDRGAVALLVERRLDVDVPQVVVPAVRDAVGEFAAALSGHPSESMTVIGITGTNGKTTTAHLIGAILAGAGRSVRVMGTLTDSLTTPEAVTLQTRLAAWRAEGVDTVVMEVSSHALVQGRVDAMRFSVAVFTNLGRDHLDLHGSLEAYFRAKARLFTPTLCARAVLNTSDPHGSLLADTLEVPWVAVDRTRLADVRITVDRITGTWDGIEISVGLGGRTNLANLLTALQVAEDLGVSPAEAAAGLAQLAPLSGRFEVVTRPGATGGEAEPAPHNGTVIVDFAHTADALSELLASLRDLGTYRRIIVVFGCGGDRDRAKRPAMGAAAAAGADCVIITSDNPRHEDPSAIIEEIRTGIPADTATEVIVLADRRAAIARGLAVTGPDDLLVVAGKGHETTETVGDEQRPFRDAEVIREVLAERAAGSVRRGGDIDEGVQG